MVHAVCLQPYHCQQQRCRHYKCENMFVVCALCFVLVLCCHSPFTFKIHIQSINPLQSSSNKRVTAASVSVFIGLKYIQNMLRLCLWESIKNLAWQSFNINHNHKQNHDKVFGHLARLLFLNCCILEISKRNGLLNRNNGRNIPIEIKAHSCSIHTIAIIRKICFYNKMRIKFNCSFSFEMKMK